MSADEYKVGTVEEVPSDGTCLVAEVAGTEVGVFRVDGEFRAVTNYCPHQAGPLCEGVVRGRMVGGDDGWAWEFDEDASVVECPWHGWEFDVETGTNVQDDRYAVPTYEIAERDGDLFLLR
ncbi:MAG: Rieske (2Fe-2S) protein [Haloferacaceae archaeon]